MLHAAGPTAVRDLATTLGVSASTIRRDLARLGARGALERVRGGAHVADDADVDRPFAQVVATDTSDKDAVAAKAAEMVGDGDVLLLDIGTTVMRLAHHLRRRPVTIITSNLAVFDVLRDDPAVELVLLGGVVRQTYLSLVGMLTQGALREVRANYAFVGTSGVRTDGEVLDSTRVEVPIKTAMMRAADTTVLLADKHKFPGTGALRVCNVIDVDVLVTNGGADERTLRTCAAAGVEVMLA